MNKKRVRLIFSLAIVLAGCQTSTENPMISSKVPSAPTALSAVANGSYQIDLTWKDNSSDETGFKIERQDTPSGEWVEFQPSLATGATSYRDTSVLPGIRYYYRVWAYNSYGGSHFARADVSPRAHIEASAVIDQAGGTFEVNNPGSLVHGAKITVPAETVSTPSIFTLSSAVAPATALPDGIEQDGPVILLECSSPVSGPVMAELPFSGERTEEELRMLFRLGEGNSTWDLVEPLPGDEDGVLRVLVGSSLPYVKGRAQFQGSTITSSFRISIDPVLANNASGRTCSYDSDGPSAGFSLIAEEYFKNFAQVNSLGLKCWWSDETSYDAACQAQWLFQGEGAGWEVKLASFFAKLGIPLSSPLDVSYLADYWKRRLIDDNPVSILMLPSGSLQGHSVLIVGWRKTDSSGKFIVYENQDNTAFREMDYHLIGTSAPSSSTMEYFDTEGNSFGLFVNASTLSADSAPIANLIASIARDNYAPCGYSGPVKIAYASWESGNGDIYVLTIDPYLNIQSNVRLTSSSAYEDSPCWSPGGERIAYLSAANGSNEIWIMNADGSNAYQLTNSGPGISPCVWSLDGMYIYAIGNSFAGDSEVSKVEVATGNITILTTVPGYNTQYFDLNLDQTKITFVRGIEYNGFSNELYTADFQVSGNDFINKTLLSGVTPAPHYGKFSWDGNRIAVHLDQTEAVHGIGVVNTDGSGFTTPIPVQNGYFMLPDWIDNDHLVYAQGDYSDHDLYVLDLRYPTLPPKRLTNSVGWKGGISVFKPRT